MCSRDDDPSTYDKEEPMSKEAIMAADLAYWTELADLIPGWNLMGWSNRSGATYVTPGHWGAHYTDTVNLTGRQRDDLVDMLTGGKLAVVLRNTVPDDECDDSPTGRHEPNPVRFGDLICVWCLEDYGQPDDEPACDICGRGQDDSPNILPKMRPFEADWNGETGNHALCEANEEPESPAERDDDGYDFDSYAGDEPGGI